MTATFFAPRLSTRKRAVSLFSQAVVTCVRKMLTGNNAQYGQSYQVALNLLVDKYNENEMRVRRGIACLPGRHFAEVLSALQFLC